MVLNLMTTPLPLPRPFLAYGGKGKSFQFKYKPLPPRPMAALRGVGRYLPQGLRNPPMRVGDPEAITAENPFLV